MVHCVVIKCNSTTGCGASFFKFPDKIKNKDLYQTWIVKIKRSETEKTGKLWEPSKYSHVCSKHFTPDSFTKNPSLVNSIGYTPKGLRLKKGSFPTISLGVEPVQPVVTGPETPRGGYRKREKQRTLQTIFSNLEDDDTEANQAANEHVDTELTPLPQLTPLKCKIAPALICNKGVKTYVKSTQTLRKVVSQGCQTTFVKYSDSSTQTDELISSPLVVPEVASSCASEDEDISDDEVDLQEESDGDWHPEHYTADDDSDSSFDEINITNILHTDKIDERKYIVFESSIKQLLNLCRECHNRCVVVLKRQVGSMVVMEATCTEGHKFLWTSQPSNKQLPMGNLLLSASILFSGASITSFLNVLNRINVSSFTDRTYRHIQSSYLTPAVTNVWKLWQMAAIRKCEGRSVKLGGDARCCSPGHTAKYGSYSLMDLETGIVLDVQLVQVTEVNNSYAMEKEGLIRGLELLKANGVKITDLTTDRHCSVRKYMRTTEPNIKHWFDVWHVAKGVYKKLVLLSKRKDCEQLAEWAQSISNHLYWAAASSDGDGD